MLKYCLFSNCFILTYTWPMRKYYHRNLVLFMFDNMPYDACYVSSRE